MKKTAVIFDLDGTLWNAVDECVMGWNSIINKYDNLPHVTSEQFKGYMGKTIEEIGEAHFTDIEPRMAHSIATQCEKEATAYLNIHGAKEYEGIREMMEAISKRHFIYIVSNCQDGYIEAFLNNHGAKEYVADYEYAGRTNRPKGENIALIMDRNNIKKAVYVGDTEGDYMAACSAGVEFIFAAYGFGEVEDAKYVAKEAKDIIKFVDEIL